ncbi:MAG: transglutaminase-like domain-containing protein [Fimbriiglobus sp.]|jgi:transglutaminase-like putative cysteine protease|nr:transglutaminase-like domain-containing protein [Fimbriiglobus sp.]
MLPLLLCAALAADSTPKLDPAQPYTAAVSDPVTYAIDFRVIVTAPQNTNKLRVWVPVPTSDNAQTVSGSKWDTFPADVKPTLHTEEVFGNTFAYFEFVNPQGGQIISHTFTAKVSEQNWRLDPAKVTAVSEWPKSFDPFRRGEQLIKVDETFTKLAGEIAAGKTTSAEKVDAITGWVQQNLTYDHSNTSLVASSTHALTKKRGDCSDYHGLCSSLGRALGVPTRVAYGLHLFPKNLPCHCKLEAYLPPYGWVSFDVSETQRLIARIEADKALSADEKAKLVKRASERMRSGFRDNTWLLVTRGTDYDLAPKASGKVPLVATIYAEADGKPFPLPDPADPTKKEFSWMTAHKYTADKPAVYPFREWKTLTK